MKGTRRVRTLRNCFFKIALLILIIILMLRLEVNDKVNLLMHQMKSVRWVEYYLGYNITTIALFCLTLILDLEIDILLHWCFEEKNCKQSKCLTSRDTKTVPTRSFYDFRFQSYGSKCVPMHDWCKFRSDMFINSGDIAYCNMEKLPMLYDGDFSLPWKRMLHFSDRCNFLQGTLDRSKHDFRSRFSFFIYSAVSQR